jgi:hypothetical protein
VDNYIIFRPSFASDLYVANNVSNLSMSILWVDQNITYLHSTTGEVWKWVFNTLVLLWRGDYLFNDILSAGNNVLLTSIFNNTAKIIALR